MLVVSLPYFLSTNCLQCKFLLLAQNGSVDKVVTVAPGVPAGGQAVPEPGGLTTRI